MQAGGRGGDLDHEGRKRQKIAHLPDVGSPEQPRASTSRLGAPTDVRGAAHFAVAAVRPTASPCVQAGRAAVATPDPDVLAEQLLGLLLPGDPVPVNAVFVYALVRQAVETFNRRPDLVGTGFKARWWAPRFALGNRVRC
jgi:hypothetical protein